MQLSKNKALYVALLAGAAASVTFAAPETQPVEKKLDKTTQREVAPSKTYKNTDRAATPAKDRDWADAPGDAIDHDYFGQANRSDSDLYRLNDLAGTWKLQVTRFSTDDGESRQLNTMTGYAERRWVLGGSQLIERYTLSGGSHDLPLQPRMMNPDRGAWPQSDHMDSGTNIMDDGAETGVNEDRLNRIDRPANSSDWQRRGSNPERTQPGEQTEDSRPNRNNNTDADNSTRSTDSSTMQRRTRPDSMQPNRTGGDRANNDNSSTNRMNPSDRNNDRANNKSMAHASDASSGIVLWGYDTSAKEFNVVWTDASTSALRFDKGKLGKDDKLTLEGSYVDPKTGDKYSTKTVISIDSPSRQTVTMYRDGGILEFEEKVYEIVYTRDNAREITLNSER